MIQRIRSRYQRSFVAEGGLLGRDWRIKVDHPLARQIIQNPAYSHDVLRAYDNDHFNSKLLARISKEHSPDVATLYFIHKTYGQVHNKQAQDSYWDYYTQLKKEPTAIDLGHLKKYFVAFVPGWGYIDDTTTGADFARQRNLITKAGIPNTLIESGEYDLVDNNAPFIAEQLRKLSIEHERIIVVSASKGGLETSLALGKYLSPSDIRSIKIWISAGGILRGSPLADIHLRGYRKVFLSAYLWYKKQSLDIIRDMSYDTRSAEFKTLSYPDQLKIYHLVAAPFATKIQQDIKSRYHMMLPDFGPNDGLTPLADEITEQGMVITEPGLNHYFRDPDIDLKTMALALMAVKQD